jgi:hypothetical protein
MSSFGMISCILTQRPGPGKDVCLLGAKSAVLGAEGGEGEVHEDFMELILDEQKTALGNIITTGWGAKAWTNC